MSDKNKKNDGEFIHNYPFDETHSPFSHFEEKILPKFVWITFIIALILTFVMIILGFNVLFVILPLGVWFIFLIIIESYLMKK